MHMYNLVAVLWQEKQKLARGKRLFGLKKGIKGTPGISSWLLLMEKSIQHFGD